MESLKALNFSRYYGSKMDHSKSLNKYCQIAFKKCSNSYSHQQVHKYLAHISKKKQTKNSALLISEKNCI